MAHRHQLIQSRRHAVESFPVMEAPDEVLNAQIRGAALPTSPYGERADDAVMPNAVTDDDDRPGRSLDGKPFLHALMSPAGLGDKWRA